MDLVRSYMKYVLCTCYSFALWSQKATQCAMFLSVYRQATEGVNHIHTELGRRHGDIKYAVTLFALV